MKAVLVAILLILTTGHGLFSQVKTEKRIEFELKEGFEGFQLCEFGDLGVLVFCHAEKAVNKEMEWKVDHYSTDLNLITSKEFSVSSDMYLSSTEAFDGNLYLFFTSRKGTYQLIQIEAETLKSISVSGVTPKKSVASAIHVVDEAVYIGFTSKMERILKRIDVLTGKDKDMPVVIAGYSPSALSFENFQIDEDSKELYVFVNGILKKELSVFVQRYSSEGKLLETTNLSENVDKTLTSVSGSYIAEGEYLYTGTYSTARKIQGSTSEGIYICKTTNGKKDFIKFYNFTDFEEFLNYLPQKQQDKIEKKKEKAESKGKEFAINYLMASHNVRFMDGKFIYIGEAFYPTYRTEYYTSYVNGKAVTQTRQVFDGYQYTHATIAAFDVEGTKLWDKTFEMFPNYKPYNIMRFIRVTETGKTELGLMFSSYTMLKSKAISTEGEVLNEKDVSMIETGSDEDKVRSGYSNLTFWYGNYFMAHGTQTIKNKEEKEERGKAKRSVYFINKISYTF